MPNSSSRASVVAIQHVESEPPGRIAEVLQRADIDLTVVRADHDQPIPTIPNGFGGVVIMGGPMGVYEGDRYPFLRDELRLIERALALRLPILGICLGSQLLASVLGARVAAAPRKEIGWTPITWDVAATHDPLFKDVSWQPLTVLHWHGDEYSAPVNSQPLAKSAETACQAFRYEDHAYGMLFHVEASPTQVQNMSTAFADELSAEGIDPSTLVADAHRYDANVSAAGRRIFNAWADKVKLQASNA